MRPDFRATWEQNWPYVLIALALSVALWLSVSAEGATQQEIPVKLIVQNLDPRYVMTSRPPDRVTVSFRGSGRDLLQLAVFSQPRLVYTVDDVRSRVMEVDLEPSMVTLPEGVRANAVDVRNGRIVLRFEPGLERRVRVVPRVEVEPAPGYAVAGPITVNPSRITIRGAESAVRSIDTLWTVPARFEALQETTVGDVEVERPDVESPLDLSVESVRVEVPVEPAAERVVEGVPVRVLGSERRLTLRPSTVTVTLRGPESRVSALESRQIEARIQASDVEAGDRWFPVEVVVPDPLVEAVSSDSVQVLGGTGRAGGAGGAGGA